MKRPFNFNLLLALGGGAILALLLYRLGLSAVAQQLWLVGWGWLLIIGQEILPILANTGGWRYAFPAPERTVKFWPLLKMRLAGDSANYLVPSATVGGEILRISLLRGKTSVPVGAASVTLAKFTQFLGQTLFIALGLLLAAPFAPLKPGLLPWLWAVLAGCLLFLGLIFIGLRRGLFGGMLGVLERWLPARLHHYLPVDKVEELDRHISDFLGSHRRAFWASAGLFGLGWALGALEVFLIFHFLGLPVDLPTAFTVETLSVFIDAVLFFVPGKLGTQEGGKVLIFMSLGYPAVAGLSFGIIRRVRELTWAGVGVACLASFGGGGQGPTAPAPSPKPPPPTP